MESNRFQLLEHLAVDSPPTLQEFCDKMKRQFELADFPVRLLRFVRNEFPAASARPGYPIGWRS